MLEGELLVPSSEDHKTKTLFCFMHPAASMAMLPYPISLARSGLHVLMCQSRYTNDSSLIMEKCVKDLATYISYAKRELRLQTNRIGRVEWRRFTVHLLPVPSNSTTQRKGYLPGKLVVGHIAQGGCIGCHCSACIKSPHFDRMLRSIYLHVSKRGKSRYGRGAKTFEYIWQKCSETTIYQEFLREFRRQQISRSLRITRWCREQVKVGNAGACFVLDGTMADPRWLDVTCDANDRPTTVFVI